MANGDGNAGQRPADESQAAPQLLWLDPGDILVPEHRIRSRFRGDEGSALEASIEAVNIQSPLGVKKVDGQWVLDDGENRLRTAIKKGIKPVPCVVTEGTMRDVIKANVSSLNKGTPNPRELMAELAAFNRDDGIEVEELAEWSGRSQEWVEKMLTMEEALSLAVKQALGDELIAVGHAELLAELDSQEEQEIALQKVLQARWTVAELRDYLNGADPEEGEPEQPPKRGPAVRNPQTCTVCHVEQRGTIQTMHVCDGCAAKVGRLNEAPADVPSAFLEALPALKQAQELVARLSGGGPIASRIGELVFLLEKPR